VLPEHQQLLASDGLDDQPLSEIALVKGWMNLSSKAKFLGRFLADSIVQ
jgi:hypothetical protein